MTDPDRAKIAKHHANLHKQYLRAYSEKIKRQSLDLDATEGDNKMIADANEYFWIGERSKKKKKGKQLSILDLINAIED